MSDFFNFVVGHFQEILNALLALLGAVIGICLLIPGDQPEKALQGVVDFLKKISNK